MTLSGPKRISQHVDERARVETLEKYEDLIDVYATLPVNGSNIPHAHLPKTPESEPETKTETLASSVSPTTPLIIKPRPTRASPLVFLPKLDTRKPAQKDEVEEKTATSRKRTSYWGLIKKIGLKPKKEVSFLKSAPSAITPVEEFGFDDDITMETKDEELTDVLTEDIIENASSIYRDYPTSDEDRKNAKALGEKVEKSENREEMTANIRKSVKDYKIEQYTYL